MRDAKRRRKAEAGRLECDSWLGGVTVLISLIAAMTPGRVIGSEGQLPWRLPEDLKHFKRTTLGHAVLMGRKTFESIGSKGLPGRRNLVVSRSGGVKEGAGAELFDSIEAAVAAAQAGGESELFVVGGGQIYAAMLGLADRMYITWVKLEPEPHGDAFFPAWERQEWREVRKIRVGAMECVVYERARS